MTIPNPERLTPEQRLTPDQITRTNTYLEAVAQRYVNPIIAIQTLFGRYCLAALPSSNLNQHILTAAVSQLAHEILNHPNPANLNLDPLPILEIDRMMLAQHTPLPEVREVLERMGPELEALSAELRQTGRLRLIAHTMSQLNVRCPIAGPTKAALHLLKTSELWLSATANELLDLADHLLANELPLNQTDSQILSLIALGELRNYRIDVGCKLLRTVLALGSPSPATYDGIDFISLQRRRDGRYGFLDRLSEKPEQASDPDLALFLPMTLNAVWLFMTEATTATHALAVAGAHA